MSIIYFILSLISWFELAVCFIVYTPVHILLFLITAPFDKHKKILHFNSSILCTAVIALCPLISVDYKGWKNIDRSKPTVIVMNHQSMLDILLIFTLFLPAKMIAKKSLARVPIVGWTLFLSGHILIDRDSRKSQIEAIRRMDNMLIAGDSLMIYPEGTRSTDGEIADFKKGAFRSACSTGTSVLPVVIDGAFKALPKKGKLLDGFHKIKISILPPVIVEAGTATEHLASKCHNLMSEELKQMRFAY